MRKRKAIVMCFIVAVCLSACTTTPSDKRTMSLTESELAIIAENNTPSETPDEESTSNQNTIVLVAGQSNEYAEILTLNAGTEFEEKQCVYYLPVGKYTAKNLNEKYPAQLNLYSGVQTNDDGFDEYVGDSFVKFLKVGESVEIEIKEGQFIEIHEPDIIELQKIE